MKFRWLPLVPMTVLAAAITGCSSPAGAPAGPGASGPATAAATAASVAPAASQVPPAPAAPSKAATPTGGKPAAGKPAGTKACDAASLHASLTMQSDFAQGAPQVAMLGLENTSKTTCTLSGWATVRLTNAANEMVAVPTTKVAEPGPSTSFALPPGTTGFAGIKWTACDKASDSCPTGNSLQVLAPNGQPVATELAEFPSGESSNLTMSKLQVGTLQPSHQGVVAW
jgi:hypothetical protein